LANGESHQGAVVGRIGNPSYRHLPELLFSDRKPCTGGDRHVYHTDTVDRHGIGRNALPLPAGRAGTSDGPTYRLRGFSVSSRRLWPAIAGHRFSPRSSRSRHSRPVGPRLVGRHLIRWSLPRLPSLDSLHNPGQARDHRRGGDPASTTAGRLAGRGDHSLSQRVVTSLRTRLMCIANATYSGPAKKQRELAERSTFSVNPARGDGGTCDWGAILSDLVEHVCRPQRSRLFQLRIRKLWRY